ncbi:hypothetical protein DPEC_G00055150 [Dallia pectoralis]|uniref:Uncharacterized protein n=1 Tax=Dallia pectoralis TaxID=75939 RepID=A0ACC2H5G3_DALPE|nr:hypothetical protein DPEC_G00055150 [Dallia pectoralis]
MNRTRSNEQEGLVERPRAERDTGDCPITVLTYQKEIGDTAVGKYRRHGSRLGTVKDHYKRRALQNMVRPLKQWLYHHRDNPYPTKTEKVLLALGSCMTLIQVRWRTYSRS